MTAPLTRIRPERVRAIAWAREAVADPATVYLDTETRGPRAGAVIVTGDRNAMADRWADVIQEELSRWWHLHPFVVIHGGCRGADTIAANIAEGYDCDTLPMPYIDKLGPAGGPARNARMVTVLSALRDVGYETLCLAFHDNLSGSKGTRNCVDQAKAAGHRVRLIRSDGTAEDSAP